jgi:nucleoside-diphosphate-sugar epimerase
MRQEKIIMLFAFVSLPSLISGRSVKHTHRDAFRANSGGTANVLNLCRCINKLSAFVYVSTYATQVHRNIISEQVHSMVPGLEEVIRRKGISDLSVILEACRPHAEDAPNSYTITKNIAEVMVQVVSEQEGFRAVIVRPPAVCAPCRDPSPGFVDDPRQGLVAFTLSLYLGVIVMFVYDGSRRFIYNTVDVIVNAILVSAYDITRKTPESPHFRVLNACRLSGETTNQLIERIIRSGQRYPSMKSLRPIHVFQCTSTNSLMTRIKKLFHHYMFAVLVDISLLLTGNKML